MKAHVNRALADDAPFAPILFTTSFRLQATRANTYELCRQSIPLGLEEVAAYLPFTLRMPRRAFSLTLLSLLVFAGGGAAHAAPGVKESEKDLKRAESVLSKLRRLGELSATADRAAFMKAARKLYPELFSKVAALGEGGLKTELTTAVFLYESASRAARQGGATPDCSRELRGTYARLCLETREGGRASFLSAKARLHVARAEAELLYARGERGAETLDAVSLIRAERGTDRALASDALLSLKELVVFTASQPEGDARSTFDVASGLEAVDRALASLPRDRTHQLLREARDAFRDGLYWRRKAAPALALVIDANSYTPRGELPRLGLRADDATRAAQANLRAALKFINKAEEELKQ